MLKSDKKNKIASNGMKKLSFIFLIILSVQFFYPAPVQSIEAGYCYNGDGNKIRENKVTQDECEDEERLGGYFVPDYVLLAPLPCAEGTPGCVFENGAWKLTDYSPGGKTPLGSYLNTMIRIFLGICAVLAMIMIVVGGLEYMTSELVSSKESGKHKITGALLGLVLAFGSYAILNTINPELLNTDSASLESVIVTVDLEADTPQPLVDGRYGRDMAGLDWATTAGAPTALPDWVTVKPPECRTVGDRSCTSVRRLGLSQLETIHAGCPAYELYVTGGTEVWLHGGRSGNTSHQPGSSTVDLRRNPALDKFLSGDKPLIRMKRYPGPGGPYLYEGNHWHIGP